MINPNVVTKTNFEKLLHDRCKSVVKKEDTVAVFNILLEELKKIIFEDKNLFIIKNFCSIGLKEVIPKIRVNIFTGEKFLTKSTWKTEVKVKKSISKFLLKNLDKETIY